MASRATRGKIDACARGRCVLLIAACDPAVTRCATVDPSSAAALGERAEIVSVNGAEASGTVTKRSAGFELEDERGGSRVLRDRDMLGVVISYEDGDVIPNEGVVTGTRRKRAYLTSGGVVFAISATIAMMSLGTFLSSSPCTGRCIDNPQVVAAAAGVWGAAGVATGALLLLGGALVPVEVRRLLTSGISF